MDPWEKQLAEFCSLVSECRRIITSSDSNKIDTLTWGALKDDPIIKEYFEERLVAIVVAAKMNKIVEVMVPTPGGAPLGKLRIRESPDVNAELRLSLDGASDSYLIKLKVEAPSDIETILKKTAGASAAQKQGKRVEDKATKDVNRVAKFQERLKKQASAVASGSAGDYSRAPGEAMPEIVEEVEEIEEFEEVSEDDEPKTAGNNDDLEAPPPPPDDDPPPPPPVDDEPPPPPPDDDEAPPPPPDDEELPPPPPDDDVPPPPDE